MLVLDQEWAAVGTVAVGMMALGQAVGIRALDQEWAAVVAVLLGPQLA